MSENLRVAVRVRPYISKIDGPESKFVHGVSTNGPQMIIKSTSGEERTFTYDFAFNSLVDSSDPNYAGNSQIYDALGKGVLDRAWNGFNVSIFSYGQTGSGKSYSMLGAPEDPGIVPMTCTEIFSRINAINADYESNNTPEADRLQYVVSVSMFEIYAEEIRDLLNPKRTSGGLRVRESPKLGPFVQDLTSQKVNSYAEISKLVDQGSAMKTVRTTAMNDKSSRSHTLVQITVSQKKKNGEEWKTTRESRLDLVDLAGSEKVNQSGVTGQGFTEAIAINTSLTFLGKCISVLADIADGKKSIVVPYRSSKLTFLLKNSLGGNASTIMLCAIRPSIEYYEETLSTLRYADQAKKIKNKPVVNEDPRDAAIRELKKEVERLRAQVGGASTTESNEEDASAMDDAELIALREQLKKSQEIIEQLQATDEEEKNAQVSKEREEALKSSGISLDFDRKSTPHLLNLQEDDQQSGLLAYPIEKVGETLIGRRVDDIQPDISLVGLSIRRKHATLKRTEDNRLLIAPIDGAPVYKNGMAFTEEVELANNDRLIVGNNFVFKVINPLSSDFKDDSSIDWDFAQQEYASAQLNASALKKQQEIEARTREINELMQKQEAEKQQMEEKRKELEEQLKKQQEEMKEESSDQAQALALLQEQLRKQQEEIANKQREFEKLKEEQHKQELLEKEEKQLPQGSIQRRVIELLGYVNDANEIAQVLKKKHHYEMRKVHQINKQTAEFVEDLVVVDKDLSNNYTRVIADEDFLIRILKMKSVFTQFLNCRESGQEWSGISPEDDPFDVASFDEPIPYGEVALNLAPLTQLVPHQYSLPITDCGGSASGTLVVETIPCDEDGNADGVWDLVGVPKSDIAVTPIDLTGKKFCFKFRIVSASGLRPTQCESTFCRYSFPFDELLHETQMLPGKNENPVWDYERLVKLDSVTADIQQFFSSGVFRFEISAKATASENQRGVHELNAEIAQLKLELQEAQSTIQILNEEHQRVVSDRVILNSRLQDAKQVVTFYNEITTSDDETDEDDAKKIEKLKEKVKKLKAKLKKKKEKNKKLKKSLKKTMKENEEIDELKKVIKSLEEDLKKAETKEDIAPPKPPAGAEKKKSAVCIVS